MLFVICYWSFVICYWSFVIWDVSLVFLVSLVPPLLHIPAFPCKELVS
ncbi:MAG: hypothetical protein F6K31_26820 [Symploca sp. SIO2G7]|nr:hypothetical protein [Symploca sp. SIO2G7]